MDMNNVNIEEIVKQVLAGMAGTAPAASAPAATRQHRLQHRQALFRKLHTLQYLLKKSILILKSTRFRQLAMTTSLLK